MTPSERWLRVQELCEALESSSPGALDARLRDLESDERIRSDALKLLEALREEERVQREWLTRAGEPPEIPDTIGPYRIAGRLGAGGSGDVFRAIRTVNGIDHPVALKRFHAHRSDRDHLARFAREQQMLAALTHPDIVHFIDAGLTKDGRPFLVMELAEGEPITAYCDRMRLRVADRLRMMRAVCEAVQAAHRHLIVHLDLKPSNILVTTEGRVKLLDFGTAKLVDPAADVTRTQSLTVLYASPEQLRGEPVSVACDIYSLGLILYELVSGSWPYRRPDTMVSIAERAAGRVALRPLDREVSPDAAAARDMSVTRLKQELAGDLDAICRKALAHDPAERYASATELAEDLKRLQDGAPVIARAATVGYRLRKFIRRNAWGAAAATAFVLGLAAAAGYSVWQAREARIAAARAEASRGFLASLFTLTGQDSASRNDMTVRELLRLAEARIVPTLGGDPVVAADVEQALANGFVSQNAFPEARALFERALARAAAAGDVPRHAAARAGRAYVLYVQNETDKAWSEASAALDLWKQQPRRFTAAQAAELIGVAAATMSYLRPTDLAPRGYFEACVDLASRSPGGIGPLARAKCLVGLASSYTIVDSRYGDALPLLTEAIALQRADPTAASTLATSLQMHGMVQRYLGRFDEDERAQREAYEIMARLHGPETMSALWQRAVWIVSLLGVHRQDEAYHESLAVLEASRRLVPEPGSYMLWTPLYSAMAAACLTKHFDRCETFAREAIETLGPAPEPADARFAAARGFLGLALARRGQCRDAQPLIASTIDMHRERRRVLAYQQELEAARAACSMPAEPGR